MPKLIENVSGMLLEETGRQVAERGYAKTTIRSVASACGIAVGTVYNYYPSKEAMVGAFMAGDWRNTYAVMREGSRKGAEGCLRTVYDELVSFTRRHSALFSDPAAARAVSGAFLMRHRQLRDQLAEIIGPYAPSEDGFTARFAAEALLTWTIADVPFDRIYRELGKLLSDQKEDPHEQF